MTLLISKMEGWELVKEIVVGGLEWVGFSKTDTGKLLCISSQKTTLIDCFSGEVLPCNCEYDEETRIAYCDELPDEEIGIAGYYGGQLPDRSITMDFILVVLVMMADILCLLKMQESLY